MAPNKVAVSLGNVKKIEIFTVTDTLSRSSTIQVNADANFAKFCFEGEKFILYDNLGRVLRIVHMSGSEPSKLYLYKFTSPYCIATGSDSSVIYITDDAAHTVTTLTLSGEILTVYKNDLLQDPCGVTVGFDNSVYVCSCDTHTVHQLTATGKFVRIILDQQRGLPRYPAAIAFDDEKDMLHISSSSLKPEYCDYVSSFKLQ